MTEISKKALATMRERGGRWAAYQNRDLSSAGRGDFQFLQFGEGCTFPHPPVRMPDTDVKLGWRYLFVGEVDLINGTVKEEEEVEKAD